MQRLFAKSLFALIAALTIGGAIYVWISGREDLRMTALIGVALLVPLAAFFGLFRFGGQTGSETPKEPVATDDSSYLRQAAMDGIATGDDFRLHAKAMARAHNLAPPDRTTIKRLAAQIDADRAKAATFARTGEVTLVRQPHSEVDVTRHGSSWLGGAPTLGDAAWPRDEDDQPLHHLAQIDLAALPPTDRPAHLPTTGALAFFVKTTGPRIGAHRVMYIPAPTDTPTDPPPDTPPLYDGPRWVQLMVGCTKDSTPRLFPRWPVIPTPVPVADPNSSAMANAYLGSKYPDQNTTNLSVRRYEMTVPAFAGPYYWDTAQRFANSLILSTEGAEPSDDYAAFVDEVAGWAFEYDGWEGLMRAEVDLLEHYFSQVTTQNGTTGRFEEFYQGKPGAMTTLEPAADASFVAAATAEYATYLALPDPVRDDIDLHWHLPSRGKRHQMFGFGSPARPDPDPHQSDHLLLQLQSDQLHLWDWNGGGVLQFWVNDAALREQAWDAVTMTVRDGCI